MKQQYNKLWFIKDKQINETTNNNAFGKNSWSPHWEKLCFLRNILEKILGVATATHQKWDPTSIELTIVVIMGRLPSLSTSMEWGLFHVLVGHFDINKQFLKAPILGRTIWIFGVDLVV